MVVVTVAQPGTNIKGLRDLCSFLTGMLGLNDINATLRGEATSSLNHGKELPSIPGLQSIKVEDIKPIYQLPVEAATWMLGLH
jgi:hypothetical protein